MPKLTSVEIDAQLAALLAERFEGSHVTVVVGDATDLAMADARFSAAVCFSMLHHVPSAELQDKLFAEAARVLRPGAPFIAVDAAWSAATEAAHEGDTYQPIDPATLEPRLVAAGSTTSRCGSRAGAGRPSPGVADAGAPGRSGQAARALSSRRNARTSAGSRVRRIGGSARTRSHR